MNINKKVLFITFILISFGIMTACQPQTETVMVSSDSAGEAVPEVVMVEEEMSFGAASNDDTTTNIGVEQQKLPQERLIIRTAELRLVVTDTDEALDLVAQMANDNGGWVVSSNVFQYREDAKRGDITIRIPSEGFESALDALQEMAVKVESVNTSGQDVTEEYVDLSSRLGNLEATADRVRSFLDETENVEEALAVNQELSRLESEIEVIKGRMQYLSQSASFSTITVQLKPDELAQPIEVGGWQPTGVVRDAVEALIGALQSLATFAIWFVIYMLPIGLIILTPLYLIIRFVRNRRRNRANDTAVSEAEPTPTDS